MRVRGETGRSIWDADVFKQRLGPIGGLASRQSAANPEHLSDLFADMAIIAEDVPGPRAAERNTYDEGDADRENPDEQRVSCSE